MLFPLVVPCKKASHGLGLGLGLGVRVRVSLDGMLSFTRLRCFLAPGFASNFGSGSW